MANHKNAISNMSKIKIETLLFKLKDSFFLFRSQKEV